jgi:hypothetical protein
MVLLLLLLGIIVWLLTHSILWVLIWIAVVLVLFALVDRPYGYRRRGL